MSVEVGSRGTCRAFSGAVTVIGVADTQLWVQEIKSSARAVIGVGDFTPEPSPPRAFEVVTGNKQVTVVEMTPEIAILLHSSGVRPQLVEDQEVVDIRQAEARRVTFPVSGRG